MQIVFRIVWKLVAAGALCFLLWLLLVRCKRKQAGFFGLAKYHYAHRGLHGNGVPENSLAAFRLAVEHGYGAELDVHLTKDGRLAVMHDENLRRTAGVDRLLCECTAEELEPLRLQGTEEKIPYLEEVLPIFAGTTPLVIELKAFRGNHAALAQTVCAMLDEHPNVRFCIESFDPRVLIWLKKHRPEIVRGQLSCNFYRDRSGISAATALVLTELLTNFLTVPHFVAYSGRDRRHFALTLCRKLWGVQEFRWTIRKEADAEQAIRDGAILFFEHCDPEGKSSCTTN